MSRATPILGTLVYCVRDQQALMLYRHKEPNLGLWVAPGGKVEHGESPQECARRELREETGLTAHTLTFRGLVTEVSPRPDWHWMLFIYVTHDFSGTVQADEREGRLRWVPIEQIATLPLPQADRIFTPRVLATTTSFYEAKYIYDDALNLVEVIEYDE
nr:8-oxo-dGTP diphosphatase [Ardenticatena sp.]